MPPVAVRILDPSADPNGGPISTWVATARASLAEHHRRGFVAAGADDVSIVTDGPADRSFGERLRDLVDGRAGGLVVLGSGSIPLATQVDRRAFVAAAARGGREALANNRYSADIVAIASVETLPTIPDLAGDNGLPRWLEEAAGYRVDDLRGRWRLAVDIDGPLDLVLLGATDTPVGIDPLLSRIAAIRGVAADPKAELLLAGRTSAASLAWLEAHSAARVRAWVEERGMKTSAPGQRAPGSVLGTLLERDGPGSLGDHLSQFSDAAIVDTRVLLAHRLGSREAGWPAADDRFASDLLLPERIADPWLQELTTSAAAARIPILFGGHTLVGPGVRLVVGGPPRGPRWR